jgi:hypothetical protein
LKAGQGGNICRSLAIVVSLVGPKVTTRRGVIWPRDSLLLRGRGRELREREREREEREKGR